MLMNHYNPAAGCFPSIFMTGKYIIMCIAHIIQSMVYGALS